MTLITYSYLRILLLCDYSELLLALWYTTKRGNSGKHAMLNGLHSLHKVHLLKFTVRKLGKSSIKLNAHKALELTISDCYCEWYPSGSRPLDFFLLYPCFSFFCNSKFMMTHASHLTPANIFVSHQASPFVQNGNYSVIFQYLFLLSNMVGGQGLLLTQILGKMI